MQPAAPSGCSPDGAADAESDSPADRTPSPRLRRLPRGAVPGAAVLLAEADELAELDGPEVRVWHVPAAGILQCSPGAGPAPREAPLSAHSDQIQDVRIVGTRPLVSPALLLDELPLPDAAAEVVLRGRRMVTGVLDREDERLLVVVGPCSVHDPVAALEYARRL